jgi:UDP-glucose 4-epimerase
MRVVVTGGAGFVASHVIEELIAQGHDVACYDVRETPSCECIVGDLLDLDGIVKATKGVDAVCHLGAVGDVYLALEKPYLAASVNATGTTNVLEACLRNDVSKMVYASTWEVYGKPDYQPLDEKHPCRPDHPYNVTKLAGEHMLMSYAHLKGLPAIALRLGTCFGTRMRGNSVFSIFIRKAMAGEPITIQGTGEQSRQFLHARDCGRAFAMAVKSNVTGEVFNLVPEESVSIKQLAEMVTKRIPTELSFGPARAGDIAPARVSAQKAKDILGWEAKTPFAVGLDEIIEEKIAQAKEQAAV